MSENENKGPFEFVATPAERRNHQFLFETPAEDSAASRAGKGKGLRGKALSTGAMIAIGSIASAGVGAGVGVAAYSLISAPAPIVVNNAESVNWVTAAAAVASPSVVTVNVSSAQSAGNGSGEFLTADGYILTNTHVVTLDGESASVNIEVKTFDGKIYKARVIGTDPTNDLAVIKVDAPVEFTPIKFADSTKLNVGDNVVAIGAPLGLAQTVTKGIVSALNRTIQVANSAAPSTGSNSDGFGGLQFFNGTGSSINLSVIQTDAAINPGNSGGALVDEKGRLVGVNVAIANAGSSGQSGSIGVGFAIPANIAKRIASEIIKTGSASHALLGAMVSDATNSSNSASFSIGAKVEKLTAGGAAEKGGVQVGDVIVKFNGTAIASASELTAAVRQLAANSRATLELVRAGKTLTLEVTLGNANDLTN
ncbi:MAG: trypsin-like peptidase domain-containing protein [Actinomycetales bacterium]|nr:trypsin-like peptidase domain-containing protein [Actinomycetales bacterium]